ncbi:MAG: hypothetical protein AAFV33_00340 [Chloroflexota bacterium]
MESIFGGLIFVFGGIFWYRRTTQLRKRTTTARQQGYMLNGKQVSRFWAAVAYYIAIPLAFFVSVVAVFVGVGNIIGGLFQVF